MIETFDARMANMADETFGTATSKTSCDAKVSFGLELDDEERWLSCSPSALTGWDKARSAISTELLRRRIGSDQAEQDEADSASEARSGSRQGSGDAGDAATREARQSIAQSRVRWQRPSDCGEEGAPDGAAAGAPKK
ncbi:unnamed protein product, partial [Prorocentrum cordatum]